SRARCALRDSSSCGLGSRARADSRLEPRANGGSTSIDTVNPTLDLGRLYDSCSTPRPPRRFRTAPRTGLRVLRHGTLLQNESASRTTTAALEVRGRRAFRGSADSARAAFPIHASFYDSVLPVSCAVHAAVTPRRSSCVCASPFLGRVQQLRTRRLRATARIAGGGDPANAQLSGRRRGTQLVPLAQSSSRPLFSFPMTGIDGYYAPVLKIDVYGRRRDCGDERSDGCRLLRDTRRR
ncbi:hypothetical protein B0H14DRAFT_2903890, partial [Mycena olivaceomarginata]